ncbi:hypothetical protein BDV25DRAFT_166691 [Aspergillus avenaceus]|uniref:Helicase C-terminal domain-containing protein n=1 Tax=Aspergillus avenaceus TaxID=36643 RepID=A0A5N6TDP4_ASPAV|nr:hypothetical protein BDV25DRAFT_166691 [Aspergillus avenaceus]
MGINIPDVQRTVVWDFPPHREICDVWQLIGRGSRQAGLESIALIFLPHWCFHVQDQERSRDSSSPYLIKQSERQQSPLLPRDNLDEASDAESIATTTSDCSIEGSDEEDRSTPGAISHRKGKLNQGQTLSTEWKTLIYGQCYRNGFLTYLGEDPSQDLISENCCNRCNPDRVPTLSEPPVRKEPFVKPRKNTRADVALRLIDRWAKEQDGEIWDSPQRVFPRSADFFMRKKVRWRLAELYETRSKISDTLEQLFQEIRLLQEWQYQTTHAERLYHFLHPITGQVNTEYCRALSR